MINNYVTTNTSTPTAITKTSDNILEFNNSDDELISLVDTLLVINLNDSVAKLNKYSITDNNGNRIYF